MGIAFYIHKLGYLDCAWLADSPDVITPQVNEHDMLSTLFFIVLEFFFQSQVFSSILTATASAGNRMGGYCAIFNSHQELGGGSGDMEVT
jgi:hypothetical protein